MFTANVVVSAVIEVRLPATVQNLEQALVEARKLTTCGVLKAKGLCIMDNSPIQVASVNGPAWCEG